MLHKVLRGKLKKRGTQDMRNPDRVNLGVLVNAGFVEMNGSDYVLSEAVDFSLNFE